MYKYYSICLFFIHSLNKAFYFQECTLITLSPCCNQDYYVLVSFLFISFVFECFAANKFYVVEVFNCLHNFIISETAFV